MSTVIPVRTVPVRTVIAFVVGALTTLAAVVVVTTAWRADALPGADEATFVPIAPCRLADTRPPPVRIGDAGPLGEGEIETFAATGSVGQCGDVPANATAVSMNVVALGATRQTYLSVYPNGDPPTAANLNPSPGQPPTPNAVTTRLSGGSFRIFNELGTVNVVIDINGYYLEAGLQDVNARIQALEADLATAVSALESDIAALDAAQPFAVTGIQQTPPFELTIPTSFTPVASVSLTAPADGHVTAFSSSKLSDTTDDVDVFGIACSISDDTVVDGAYEQAWEHEGAATREQIAGTRRFTVSEGQQLDLQLVCFSFDDIKVSDSVITAIFTPDP